MSRSPERISSYRRHFEDNVSSSYQVRVSSPSPTRREGRHGSPGFSCRAGAGGARVESVGRRNASAARRSRMVGTGMFSKALVCVGPDGEPPMDLDATAAENKDFLNTRTSEKREMVILNDRLAVYIDKVRSLEQQNKLLETEIEAYQNRFEKPTGLRLMYEEQLRELRKIADQMKVQRDISLAAKESTAAQLEATKVKYEEALELRKKAEADIEAFRPDVDQATSSRIALEKKLEQLEVEIEFLKRVHQQEIEELMRQIYAAHMSATSGFGMPDLAAALKQIQTQYDDIAAKNLQDMDSWYQSKFDDISKKSTKHVDAARSFREEMAGARKDIQNKGRDLDSLRTKNEALEAEILERQQKYKKEIEDRQARIETLQLELKSIKEKIALHLREYQDLLNVKMALEIEITTYRKLIEGEDLRLSGMVQTLQLTGCSMSAFGAGMSISGGGVGGVRGMGGGVIASSDRVEARQGGERAEGHSTGSEAGPNRENEKMGIVSAENKRRVVGSGNGISARGEQGRGVSSDMAPGRVGSDTREMGTGGQGSKFAGERGNAGGLEASELGVGARGAGGPSPGEARDTGAGRIHPSMNYDGSSLGGVDDGVITNGLGAGTKTNMGDVRDKGGRGVETIGTKPGGPGGNGSGLGSKVDVGSGGTGDAGFGTNVSTVGAVRRNGSNGGFGQGTNAVAGGVGLAAGISRDNRGLGSDVRSGSVVSGGGADARSSERTGTDGDAKETRSQDERSVRGEGHGTKAGGLGPNRKDCGSSAGVENAGGTSGVAKTSRGPGDFGVSLKGYGFDGSYGQAVELTERRTVLIRTIKHADDVLEMDHQEQTYTISGAADESDNE